MKVEKLRVGNWVSLICGGHKNEPNDFQWDINHYEYFYERMNEIKPIPLTEEWLIRFGFKVVIGLSFEFNGFETRKDEDVWIVWKLSSYLICIKYVHQLQNLYFALTGKELTISNDG